VFAAADPEVARVLFTTPAGWACLVVGLGLDAAGLAASSWLVRAVAR
jgi:Flp pilus assembly protein TadB